MPDFSILGLPKTQRRAAGNTILEYVLPGLLVLAVTIGTLNSVGINLNGYFDSLKNTITSQINSTQKQAQIQQAQKEAFQAAQAALLVEQASVKPAIAASTTANMPLPQLADVGVQAVGQAVQTVGANGATELLASSLESYIRQLEASNSISPEQIDLLSRLAMAGHTLANAEKVLADAQNSGQSNITYSGSTYSVSDFAQQFGFVNNVGMDAATNMDAGSAMSQLAPFMNLYAEAQASGALSDPNVGPQVTYLSKQIAALSDLAKWNPANTTDAANLNSGYVTAMGQIGVSKTPPSISVATHINSTEICNTGDSAGVGCN